MTHRIYLCSKSPRRAELLELTGLKFEVFSLDDVDEEALLRGHEGDVIGRAEYLAREKAKAALRLGKPGIFITADTLVIADDGAVLGKPADTNEAELFLDRLAGNWHTVATGVALSEVEASVVEASEVEASEVEASESDGIKTRTSSLVETTRVKFASMTAAEIRRYIATGEPFDKAGGYGIQGRASVYIERIEGCYFNVVGFPVHAFWEMWKAFTKSDRD
jgi:septum formation protein